MMHLIRNGILFLRQNGLKQTYNRTIEIFFQKRKVLKKKDFSLSPDMRKQQEKMVFQLMPKFSILVPLYNTPEIFLVEMIESVRQQTYKNWELCMADGSDDEHRYVEKICTEYKEKDARIKYQKLKENGGISANTNACIDMAEGDYIALFDHDDVLTEDALYEVVKEINSDNAEVIYTDEDKLLCNAEGKEIRFVAPHYKPDFNIDLLRSCNYITHFFVVKANIAAQTGGFHQECDGSQDYDFILRCVEHTNKIAHISKILYHWRIHADSTAANPNNKLYCYEAGRTAIEGHLKRMKEKAFVEITKHPGYYRVRYELNDSPLVSIMISSDMSFDMLQKLIHSIISKTTYKNYEIIVVSTQTKVMELLAIEHVSETIFWSESLSLSKMNNLGVKHAKGDYFIFLNKAVEIITDSWIEEMLGNTQRNQVGITGIKLQNTDQTIHSCGAIVDAQKVAKWLFCGCKKNVFGLYGRAFAQQNLNIVSGQCFMLRRDTYQEIGSFDENLSTDFYCVDACIRMRTMDKLVVFDPNAIVCCKKVKQKRDLLRKDTEYILKKWPAVFHAPDMYFNPNLKIQNGYLCMK